MVESVSTDPFEVSFDVAFNQMKFIDDTMLKMANLHPSSKQVMKDLGIGPVTRPRTGMSTQLGMYTRMSGKWHHCASCDHSCRMKDYTGSYHVSISLPSTVEGWVARDPSIVSSTMDSCSVDYDLEVNQDNNYYDSLLSSILFTSPEAQKQREWIEAHKNLGNMIQWIEPLLISVFGSADADSICDAGRYTEGSYRTLAMGWGIPGTSDVRTFQDQGTSRYVKEGFDWVFPNETENSTKTTTMPSAYREDLMGCMEDGMGADIRTKSKVSHPQPGEIIPPMEVGRGIEVRIFDNFPVEYLPEAYRLIALIAEAGRNFNAKEYIYDDPYWTEAMQSVMREGWNAILPEEYVRRLSLALNLPSNFFNDLGHNFQAFHVYSTVYTALWKSHKHGMWFKLMVENSPDEILSFSNPNRESWELAAISQGYTPDRLMETLGLPTNIEQSSRVVHIQEVRVPMESCNEDVDDLLFLAESFGMVSNIQFGTEGRISSFTLHPIDEFSDATANSEPICLSMTRKQEGPHPLH